MKFNSKHPRNCKLWRRRQLTHPLWQQRRQIQPVPISLIIRVSVDSVSLWSPSMPTIMRKQLVFP